MKLQNSISQIELGQIFVREGRQRQVGRDEHGTLKDTAELEASIKKHGLLQPITVSLRTEGGFWLEIGERRLTAHRKLEASKILARKVTELSETDREIIELVENINRQDLAWQDQVRGVARLHSMFRKQDPDWTMQETGAECCLEKGTISMYISVAAEMDNERIRNAGSVREAYNTLGRRAQREAGEALQELLDSPDIVAPEVRENLTPAEQQEVEALRELGEPLPVHLTRPAPPRIVVSNPAPVEPEAILQQSFLDWAPAYTGSKFNLIHCDFPYGVELFSGPQGRAGEMAVNGQTGYKDSAGVYWTLIESLCRNLDRIMSVSAHLMFWLSADIDTVYKTKQVFADLAPSLKFHKFPMIWQKSDNAGIASDPRHGPRHIYEACLLASRGSRNITRVKSDAYSAPTDKKLHPSTKPEPMLRHFMEMLVDDTTTLLDPTCGSGAALRAADSLGAKSVLGLEIDKQYIGPARLALKQARGKKEAREGAEL